MGLYKIYVGNLNYDAGPRDLIELFSKCGHVTEVTIIPNKHEPGKSKGFGFVTFENEFELQEALKLNGENFMNREIVVRLAKDKAEVIYNGEK
jgi:RNA recognition motif-containing protein